MAELGSSRPGLALPGEAEPGVASGGGTQITPGTGALTLTGQPVLHNRFTPRVAALALTGQQPLVRYAIRITPNTGSLTISGQTTGAATQSQIISKEYTGDGASTRSFASLGFLPLFVVVIGKDGGGNVVGALKSSLMPAGESQPFQEAVALGGAARLNRIISLDLNGFTVGPDLNVTGRKYAYIMFPAGRFGAVTQGSYTGNNVTAPGHALLGVTATEVHGVGPGSTGFVKQEYCDPTWYRPAGSTPYTPGAALILGGRRMIRESDGAVLAEATFYNNDSSCEAIGYIIGNEGNWHWEEQYIELHTLVPDMLWLTCDDSPGQGIPVTVTPPPTNDATGWSLNVGTPVGFFASNTEAVLHLPGDTALRSFNNNGKRYHWFALKGDEAGSGGVRMKTFQYTGTGDGPYPIDLVGCGFDPEWVLLQKQSDQMHWSKRTANIIGTDVSRRWLDGGGDHINTNPNYAISFISDGVRIPATNTQWNILGVEYTVVCVGVAAPTEVTTITPATGSLTLTSQTPKIGRTITPITGLLALNGQAASTKGAGSLTPQTGSLTLTGRTPVIIRTITPNTGSLTLTGRQPVVQNIAPTNITPNTGSLTITGRPASATIKSEIGTGVMVLTGRQPIVAQTIFIEVGTALGGGGPPVGGVFDPDVFDSDVFDTGSAAPSESLVLTGQQPILRVSTVEITPATGTLTLTGQQATVRKFITEITPNTAEIHIIGKQPVVEPRVAAAITPGTGSLIITPKNPIRAVKRTITPRVGSLRFDGKAAKTKETHSPGPPPKNRKETPDTGELQITGRQPVLKVSIRPFAGSLTTTGQRCFVRPPDFLALPQKGTLTLVGQQPKQRITITPGTGALVVDGKAVIPRPNFPTRLTLNTGELQFTGRQPVLKVSIIPVTGELQLQTFNTEPIVETNVTKITPIAGVLTISGVSPASTPIVEVGQKVTPNTGALVLTGQTPIVSTAGGGQTITPGTGALTLVGRRPIIPVPVPPIPPGGLVVGGGIGLPTPRKLPFWPKTIITARGRIIEPAGSFRGRARVAEDELAIFLE